MNYYSRWLPAIGALLWVGFSPSPGIAQRGIDKFVVVQSVTTEKIGQSLDVKVQLVNISTQIITAFSLTATITYPDARTVQGWLTKDMLPALVYERMGYPAPADTVFGPGQVSTIRVPVVGATDAGSSPVVQTSAIVKMIALADKTALGSNDDIKSLMYSRTNDAGEAKDVVAALGELRRSPNIRDTVRALLSNGPNSQPAEAPSASAQSSAERRLHAMRSYVAPLADRPQDLPASEKAWQIRYDLTMEHSSLHPRDLNGETQENHR